MELRYVERGYQYSVSLPLPGGIGAESGRNRGKSGEIEGNRGKSGESGEVEGVGGMGLRLGGKFVHMQFIKN